MVITSRIFHRFVLLRLEPGRPNSPVGSAEMIMASYFAMSFLREMAQLGIALGLKSGIDGLTDYLLDFWNILDLSSLFAFFIGLALRVQCINDASGCSWGEATQGVASRRENLSGAATTSDTLAPSPWERWALCYSICLLCWLVILFLL